MSLTWIPDVLRAAGLDVFEYPGWKTRTSGKLETGWVKGVVCHHTASGPNWQDGHVAALLAQGRRDLAGPLAQLGLERDGTFVVISVGRCNHNGYGEWGNSSIGIEAYNSGLGEPWPVAQMDAYKRGVAAILAHLGLPATRCKAHRETDPRRKIDPTGVDMDAFRADVANPEDDMTDDEHDKLNATHMLATAAANDAAKAVALARLIGRKLGLTDAQLK